MKAIKDQVAIQSIRFFWRHAWKYKLHVIGLLLAIPTATLLLWFIPSILIADIFNRISAQDFIKGDLWGSFGGTLLLYALIVFVSGVLIWRIAIFFVWRLERNVLRDIYREIFAHLMNLSANFHANRFGGSLVSQTNKIAGAYVRFADTTWFQFYGLILAFVFALIILLPRAPIIAVLLLVFSVIFMAVSVRVTKRVRELSSKQASMETKQTGVLADAITNVMAIKSFAGGHYEHKRFAGATDRVAHATDDMMWASLMRESFFAVSTITISMVALLFAIGGVVLDGADVGTAFLIVTYTGIIGP